MKDNNEMFQVTNAKKVILKNNETSIKKMLRADNINTLEAIGNKAGLKVQDAPKKRNKLKRFLTTLITWIIAPLLVAWIIHRMGW